MKNTPKTTKVGIGWYSENEWYKLCTVAADADKLEKTYEEWLKVFHKGYADLLKAGIAAVKIPVYVQELIDWCNKKGLAVNGEARSQFIAEQLRNQPEDNPRKESKDSVKEALFEAIENQIRDDNPKETRLTLERLVREGHPQNEAMRLIAFALVQELNGMLKNNKPFNQVSYIKALKALPKLP